MTNLTTINHTRGIPVYSVHLNSDFTFKEWLNRANKIAKKASWTNENKLKYYQDRLTGAAESSNNSLTATGKPSLTEWTNAMETGFNYERIRYMKKK
jgi:hypothetical protein